MRGDNIKKHDAPKCCDVILARWEKYTGKQAVLETK